MKSRHGIGMKFSTMWRNQKELIMAGIENRNRSMTSCMVRRLACADARRARGSYSAEAGLNRQA